MESFGQRLKRLRKLKGLSLKEVATAIGIPISTYREWEYGRAVQGEPYLKIAETLGVSTYELLGGKTHPKAEVIKVLGELESKVKELKSIVGSFL